MSTAGGCISLRALAGLRPELVPVVEIVEVLPTVHNPTILELKDNAAARVQLLAIPLRDVVMNTHYEAIIAC